MNSGKSLVEELFPEFLTLSQAASLIDVTEQDVECWVKERKLPYFQSGDVRRFNPEHVRRLVKRKGAG